MSHWEPQITRMVDLEVIEETALAMAQATIQNAINEAGLSRADLARKMKRNRSIISRILSGDHNLTIKTMARTLAACNVEVRFHVVPLEWRWSTVKPMKECAVRECGQYYSRDHQGSAGLVLSTV